MSLSRSYNVCSGGLVKAHKAGKAPLPCFIGLECNGKLFFIIIFWENKWYLTANEHIDIVWGSSCQKRRVVYDIHSDFKEQDVVIIIKWASNKSLLHISWRLRGKDVCLCIEDTVGRHEGMKYCEVLIRVYWQGVLEYGVYTNIQFPCKGRNKLWKVHNSKSKPIERLSATIICQGHRNVVKSNFIDLFRLK